MRQEDSDFKPAYVILSKFETSLEWSGELLRSRAEVKLSNSRVSAQTGKKRRHEVMTKV